MLTGRSTTSVSISLRKSQYTHCLIRFNFISSLLNLEYFEESLYIIPHDWKKYVATDQHKFHSEQVSSGYDKQTSRRVN